MKTVGLLLVTFLLLPTLTWAEDAAPQHRVLVLYTGPEREKYVPPLVTLLSGDRLHLFVLVSSASEGLRPAEASKEARRFACDLILAVTTQTDSDKQNVVWSLSSPDEPKPRATGRVLKSVPDGSTLSDLYWLFLSGPLAKELGPGAKPWPAAAVAARKPFVVKAQPGTLVTGLPSGAIVVPGSGQITLDLDIPVSLTLEGHLIGWRTQPLQIFVSVGGQEATLVQTKIPEWALTASLNNFAFPSFGVEWIPLGRNFVLRAQVDQFLGGLAFGNRANSTESAWPVQSLPLLTLQLGAAWYWSWPEDQLRFYTAFDMGSRWMYPQFKIFVPEPVVPFTLEPLVGWDFRWADRHSLYFELGPTIEYAPDPELFLASLKHDASNVQIQLGGPFFLEFPLKAKVGYRWSF